MKQRDRDKLAALRSQLGANAWQGRIDKAKEKEAIVVSVRALMDGGVLLADAVERVSPGTRVATVADWMGRYRRGGLDALISRLGRTATDRSSPPRTEPKAPAKKRALSFVKWVGSKAQVRSRLLERAPSRFGTYYEPMVGSGILFLELTPKRAVLSDLNAELMNCYAMIRDRMEELVEALSRHENTYEHFLGVRDQEPEALPEIERAARTIYLNKTCFNGLYRVNNDGRFNVPYGRVARANFLDLPTLRRVHQRLQGVELRTGDFEAGLEGVKRGDFVYLDPPYATESDMARRRFHHYQPEAFAEEQHRRLAQVFRTLTERGVKVLLSNSDVPLVRELYGDFAIEELAVRRMVNADVEGRHGWSELLISNFHEVKSTRPSPRLPVAEVLFGYGVLPREDAIRIAAEELAELGLAPGSRLAKGGRSWRAIEQAIDSAIARRAMDRPAPGCVRSFLADPSLYHDDHFDLAIQAVLGRETVTREDAVALALSWAEEHLGLRRSGRRLARCGLEAALDRLIAARMVDVDLFGSVRLCGDHL